MSFYFKFQTATTRFQPPAPAPPVENLSISILVFKTSIRSIPDIKKIEDTLGQVQGIIRWNVDHYDIDNVLRIETIHNDPARITSLVRKAGFFCEELPD